MGRICPCRSENDAWDSHPRVCEGPHGPKPARPDPYRTRNTFLMRRGTRGIAERSPFLRKKCACSLNPVSPYKVLWRGRGCNPSSSIQFWALYAILDLAPLMLANDISREIRHISHTMNSNGCAGAPPPADYYYVLCWLMVFILYPLPSREKRTHRIMQIQKSHLVSCFALFHIGMEIYFRGFYGFMP